MPTSIANFKSAVEARGDMARGVFFDVSIAAEAPGTLPFSDPADLYLCKAANLPAAQLDVVGLKYFTRTVNIPGSRQFAPVTLTFYHTNNYQVRFNFLEWLSRFNTPISNVRGASETRVQGAGATAGASGVESTVATYATLILKARDMSNIERAEYRFVSAFPSSVGGLQYSYENDTQVQTYDVEFQYLNMTVHRILPAIVDQTPTPTVPIA